MQASGGLSRGSLDEAPPESSDLAAMLRFLGVAPEAILEDSRPSPWDRTARGGRVETPVDGELRPLSATGASRRGRRAPFGDALCVAPKRSQKPPSHGSVASASATISGISRVALKCSCSGALCRRARRRRSRAPEVAARSASGCRCMRFAMRWRPLPRTASSTQMLVRADQPESLRRRRAGEPRVAVVRRHEPCEAFALAARHDARATAAPRAEARPRFEQLGAVELHRVVRRRRAQVTAHGTVGVGAGARCR